MTKESSERDIEKLRKKILPLLQAAIEELERVAIQEGKDSQELVELEHMHRKARIERERSHD
jgi:hypothetical protein